MKKFRKNLLGTDYFVGDIHGEYNLLFDKLVEKKFDKSVDRLFSVGDLIDRGPNSLDCLKLLKEDWFYSVLGNHEDMMIDWSMYNTWMMNGGTWAIDLDPEIMRELRELIKEKMPLRLEVETEFGKIGLVHAEPNDDWESEAQHQQAVWSRRRINSKNENLVKNIDLVVCGHTPNEHITKFGNVVWIDTGACFVGNLTVLSARELFNL